jgi:hypothetical protein
VSFNATCICRGAVDVLVTRPTVAVSSVEDGAAKLGVFRFLFRAVAEIKHQTTRYPDF